MKKIVILGLSLFCLILLYVGTYSYYSKVINGKINGSSGVFIFDISNNINSTSIIDLYDSISDPSIKDAREIVPGDNGSFVLTVNGYNSDVDIEYSINFNSSNLPSNMKFYLNNQSLDVQTNKIKGYLDIEKEKSKSYNITWEWPYDSGKYNDLDYDYAGLNISIDIEVIGKQSKGILIYGIKRDTNSSSTEWERIENSIDLTANAVMSSSDLNVQNDFDNIYPWSEIKSYNYDTNTKKVTAWYGDENFKFDGSNGEVLTYIPGFYYKREVIDDIEYQYISEYEVDGYSYSKGFSVGRYGTSYVDKATSRSGVDHDVAKTITTFRNDAKELGDDFGIIDYHYFILQMLYLVEYADYDSQNILGLGVVSLRRSDHDKVIVAENNTNRIIVSSSTAEFYDVGSRINISFNLYRWDVARTRTITNKVAVNGGVAIYFDGDAIDVNEGYYISHFSVMSGETDELGMKSGTLNNDGKHSMIYRGIENIYGNLWIEIDGINIKNNEAYVCYDPNEYIIDKYDGCYKKLSYVNANSDGFVKKLGYDNNNSLVAFPTSVSSSYNSYIKDGYKQHSDVSSVFIGGGYNYSYNTGLWFYHLGTLYGNSDFVDGSRLLKYS